jgi:hypothetical protein
MNAGVFRSRQALWALGSAGAMFAWHVTDPLPFGDRSDGNVPFLLTTGWLAVACYVALALYAARRAAHRLRLSPEFAWRAQVPALEAAQSALAGLQQRIHRREALDRRAVQRAAAQVLRTHGVQRVLAVTVTADPTAIGGLTLQVGPREPLGRLAAWLHVHVWWGVAAALLVWFHGGARTGSTMGLWLNGLSAFVIASGLAGAALWSIGPTLLTRAERELTVERAFGLRDHLARKIAEAQAAPAARAQATADDAAAAEAAATAAAAAAAREGLAGAALDVATKAAKKADDAAAKARAKATAATAAIPTETERLRPEVATLVGQFAAVAEEARRLGRYRALLRGWRLVHVPASILLLALVAVHVYGVCYY